MNIETRRLADLKPAAYNPRKKLVPGDPEYEKIARSIEESPPLRSASPFRKASKNHGAYIQKRH